LRNSNPDFATSIGGFLAVRRLDAMRGLGYRAADFGGIPTKKLRVTIVVFQTTSGGDHSRRGWGDCMLKRYLSMLSISGGAAMTMALWAGQDEPLPAPRAMPKLKPPLASVKLPDGDKKSPSQSKTPMDVDTSFDPPTLPPLDAKQKAAKPITAEVDLPPAPKTEFKAASKSSPMPVKPTQEVVPDEKRIGVSAKPSVEIRQSMPGEVRYGQPIPVDLVVVNSGPVMVEKVIVTQDLAKGVDLLSASPNPTRSGDTLIWSLGEMEPRQSRSIKLKLGLRMGEAEPELKCNAKVKYESAVASVAKVYQPKLVVETTSPVNGVVNGKMKMEIKISNVGNSAAKSVILRAPLPPEVSHQFGPDLENDLGRLEAGESRLVPLSLTGVKSGKTTGKIIVSTDGAPSVEKTIPIEILQVHVGLTAKAPKTRFLHRPNDYQFTVTNKGPAEATEAKLTAALPKGISFVHASESGQYDAGKHEVVWAVGNVKPGETREITMTGVATELGDQQCKAMLAANGIQQEAMCATMVQGVAAMQMEVVDTVDPLEVGGTTIFAIKVVNQGTAVQQNLQVTCVCPSAMQPLDTRAPVKHKIEGQRVVFEKAPLLEPRDEMIFKVKCKGLKPGDARFRVEAVSDQQIKPLIKEEATRIFGDTP
jgi:uncharacterized repeat protein (TIGR01451 family)